MDDLIGYVVIGVLVLVGSYGLWKWFSRGTYKRSAATVAIALVFFSLGARTQQRKLCPYTIHDGRVGPSCDWQTEAFAAAGTITVVLLLIWGLVYLLVITIRRWRAGSP